MKNRMKDATIKPQAKSGLLISEIQNSESLIDYNLSLSPEERVLNHQRALDTINELKKANEQIYGKSKSSSETSS